VFGLIFSRFGDLLGTMILQEEAQPFPVRAVLAGISGHAFKIEGVSLISFQQEDRSPVPAQFQDSISTRMLAIGSASFRR